MKTNLLKVFVICVLLILGMSAFGQMNRVEAANVTLTIHVYSDAEPNGTNQAQVAIQRCDVEVGGTCTVWGKVVKLGTTDAVGDYAPSLPTATKYRVAVTKDNHICVTPSDCTRTFTLNSAVTKTFQLDSQAASSATCPIRYNSTTTAAGWLGERIKVAERAEDSWTPTLQNVLTTEMSSYAHSWFDNNPAFSSAALNVPRRMFKVDQRRSVIGNVDPLGASALAKVYMTASNNPGAWWIIGEEPNALSGEQAMPPTAYAQFFKAYAEQILTADSTAKIVVGYLAHEWSGHFSDPFQYYSNFYSAWRANYASFCPEPPVDAFHVNYTPWLNDDNSSERIPRTEWAKPVYTIDYVNKWRDYFMEGSAGGTLINEFFSLGTYEGCRFDWNTDCPTQAQAARYWQGVYGELFNSREYPWIGLVMNFPTYPVSGELLWHTSIYTDTSATVKHQYFPIFANVIAGNAGFEQGDINGTVGDAPKQWSQCTSTHCTLRQLQVEPMGVVFTGHQLLKVIMLSSSMRRLRGAVNCGHANITFAETWAQALTLVSTTS